MKLKTKQEIENIIKKCDRNYTEDNKNLVFKCVQKAQELKDLDLEYKTRLEYVAQLTNLNYHEKAIPIFPWLLECCDTYPKRFRYSSTLWTYKWIVISLFDFASISYKQIETVFDDFENRYNKYGSGQRILEYYKMIKTYRLGNPKEALQHLRNYEMVLKNGPLDDCEACMVDGTFDILIEVGLFDEVLEKARPILDKNLTCVSVPKTTYPRIMYVYMIKDKIELAEKYYQLSIQNLNLEELNFIDYHYLVLYLAVNNRFVEGISIIEKQLNLILERSSDKAKCLFYQSCNLFFLKMFLQGKNTTILDLSSSIIKKDLPDHQHNNYQTKKLSGWFKNISYHHAEKLGLRNSNNFYHEKLDFYSDIFKKLKQ